jgi:hypothetical protein
MSEELKPNTLHTPEIMVSDDGEGLVREGKVRSKKRIFSIYLNQTAVDSIEKVCAISGTSKNAWIQLAISEKLMRESSGQ